MPTALEAYKKLLASNPENERAVETITLSHPNMSKTYYLVRDTQDFTATLETAQQVTFQAMPMEPENAVQNDDLDQSASVTMPDVFNELDSELELIGDSSTPVEMAYRVYHTDYPDEIADGPYFYDVDSISQEKGRLTIHSGVPKLNAQETGTTYNYTDFPMLEGL